MFLHSARSLLQTVRMFFRIFQIVLKVFLFPIWSVLLSSSTSETSVLNLEKFVYEPRIDGYLDGKYDQYLKNNDFSFDELFLDIFSVATASSPSNSLLGKSNQLITVCSVTQDFSKLYSCSKNVDVLGGINSGTDLIIDAVGAFGLKGLCISIGLKYTKRGAIFSVTEMAKGSIEFERYTVNRWTETLFGVKLK